MSDRVVVMNEGKVQQIGPPEEIYARPVSPFVAGFIGVANLLPAKVKQVDGHEMLLVITSYSIHYTKLYDGCRWSPGGR